MESSFLKRFYERYLAYYRDVTLLKQKLEAQYTSIVAFLWLGLGILILAFVGAIFSYFYGISQKDSSIIASKHYIEYITKQIPDMMTGAFQRDGENVFLHLNNDTKFTLSLLSGESQDQSVAVIVDTSLKNIADISEDEGFFILQNGIAIKKSSGESRWFDYGDIEKNYELFSGDQQIIPITKEMLIAIPDMLPNVLQDHWGKIIGIVTGMGFLFLLFFGGFLLGLFFFWYLLVHGIIWILVSIIRKFTTRNVSYDTRDIIMRVSFLPFLIYFFVGVSIWVYVMLMVFYICWRIYQLYEKDNNVKV